MASPAELRKAFDEFDVDKSGAVDEAELKYALEKAGLMPSIKEIKALIKKVDANNSGQVEFEEFGKLYELIQSNAYAAEVGGQIKLMKERNQDVGKYPQPSAKWAKTHGSGRHGGSNYVKSALTSPRNRPPPKKGISDLP